MSRVLGLNLSDAIGIEIPITSTLVKNVDAEISRNTGEVLSQRREQIEELKAENEALSAELKEKDKKLLNIHAEYNRRIDALYAELKSCRDKLDAVNRNMIEREKEHSDRMYEFLHESNK
jgi:peptidoglycan hydrolase CwlO-like protein